MSESSNIADVLEGRASWCVVPGDNRTALASLPAGSIDHVITDPPYSERTHAAAAARDLPDGNKRRVFASKGNGFGFDHLPPEDRARFASDFARCVRRWVLVFTDQEGIGPWHEAIEASPLDHVRIGQWIKVGATPQFTGDRPAQGCEAIVIAHAKGRKRWNSGGKHAVWTHPIAALEARSNGDGRPEHLTPKPVSLMLELLQDFTDAGDLILDPFCGGGTTGVAAIRLGRRFIGCEIDAHYAQVARDRIAAESRGLTLRDVRAGQSSIFDVIGADK